MSHLSHFSLILPKTHIPDMMEETPLKSFEKFDPDPNGVQINNYIKFR